MTKDILERINYLVDTLNKLNNEYYVENNSSVDDLVFDQYLEELKGLEKKYPELIQTNSPTQKVGSSLSKNFAKSNHRFANMMSLDDVFNFDDLKLFIERIEKGLKSISGKIRYSVEPKIDGMSLSLFYKDGKLVQALTRGDGKVGEDVTNNANQIDDIPKTINFKNDLIIRGEVYMTKLTFEKLNEQRALNNELLFANPRNATAGTMRQINEKVVKKRGLSFIAYTYLEEKIENSDQIDLLKKIKDLGFKISLQNGICETFNDLVIYIKNLEKIRDNILMEIDGVVIKLSDVSLQSELGSTAKYPRWAVAYKFPAEIKSTKLLDIFSSVGRTGRITYNAKLEPIILQGSTVSFATLHNASYINNLDLRIGDHVKVKKAGDIIPKVISIDLDNIRGDIKWIEEVVCPSCNSKLVRYENEIDQYCLNDDCPQKLIEKLVHFSSRDAMNIEGLNEKQIELFINEKLIRRLTDIYLLKNERVKILKLHGYQKKSVDNLIESIEKSKNNSLEHLIFGLGIRYIGFKTSLVLATLFKDIRNIFNVTIDELLLKSNLGVTKSESISKWFNTKVNIAIIEDLISNGVSHTYKHDSINSHLSGKTILVTGTISGGTRSLIKQILTNCGANVVSSPSKKVEILIEGEGASKDKIIKSENSTIISIRTLVDLEKYAYEE